MSLSFLMFNSKCMLVNNPPANYCSHSDEKCHSGESTDHFPVVGKTDLPM